MQGMGRVDPIAFPHNSAVTPTEIMETQAPILIVKKELLPGLPGRAAIAGAPAR